MYPHIRQFIKMIPRRAAFAVIFFFCFASASYLAIAASDSIQVQQTVGEEGSGEEVPEDSPGGFALPMDATPPEIVDMRIYDIGLHSAEISFHTDEISLVELYYSRDESYGSGPMYDHADSYEDAHQFSLKDLDAGAKYHLKIVIKNQKGVSSTVTSYSFYTIPEFAQIVPDVGSLRAIQEGKNVVLDWDNPDAANFQGVQISRQACTFALDPDQGEKVFFGSAERFVDADVQDGVKYYYTVFAFDTGGKFSAGAAVSIRVDFSASGGSTVPAGDGEGTSTPDNPSGNASGEFVKDVRNLEAAADVAKKTITLDWEYPEADVASEVDIRRDINFPPMSPLEGTLVYSGSATSFEDRDVRKGQTYFYAVFVRNKEGIYSSGKIIASELKEAASEATSPEVWKDLSFVDVRSGIMFTVQEDESVHVMQGAILGVNYGVDSLPSNLTAVAAQIGGSSYLFSYSEESHSFKTSFAVPSVPGEYDFDVVFLNADNEVFFEKDLKLKVRSRGQVYYFKREELFGSDMSWGRMLCRIGNLFGGENQECMSRTPVAEAEMSMLKKNQDGVWEIWNAKEANQVNPFWTDSAGQYGFCLPNGEYEVEVRKEGFKVEKVQLSVQDNILRQEIRVHAAESKNYLLLLLLPLIFWVLNKIRKKILHRIR